MIETDIIQQAGFFHTSGSIDIQRGEHTARHFAEYYDRKLSLLFQG